MKHVVVEVELEVMVAATYWVPCLVVIWACDSQIFVPSEVASTAISTTLCH